ncbi:hypothetical protein HK101_001745 [Irineochytrium annulatum]|nr:hypothetical protein HK101_001745 [Irineochytrium annulatum]
MSSRLMMNEKAFSQSEGVSRCRGVKEAKIKALYGLSKLADEEVTIHQAHLEETYNALRTKVKDERAIDGRQQAEAADVEIAGERKRQLVTLVDKVTALKLQLRFQEEQIDKELALGSSIRRKREAFQIRLERLEERHMAERNELMIAQNRVRGTIAHIRDIELNSQKDQQVARRKRKENEILAQQSKMQQQKEFEFLREMQIVRIKHLSQINDMEINFVDEIEGMAASNRQEEFELVAKQTVAEQQAFDDIEKQKRSIDIIQQQERHNTIRIQAARNFKKQEKIATKQQRAGVKMRERTVLAENPIILAELSGDEDAGLSDTEGGSSYGGSRTDGSDDMSVSDVTEELERKGKEVDLDLDGEHHEARVNSQRNKSISGECGSAARSEADKVLESVMEQGKDRLKTLLQHHKKLLTDLRAVHRNNIAQKQREQRRKMSEVRKEHEEEIEGIKTDQAQAMKELIATQQQSDDIRKDSDSSQRLLGLMLPSHVMEEIEAGRTPEPKSYDRVTLFFTDLLGFKELSASSRVSPISILHLLNAVYSRFDAIVARYDCLYKVESVADTYMIAAGLGDEMTEAEFKAATVAAAKCAQAMMDEFEEMDLGEFGIEEGRLEMRAGMHTGAILAGIIGTKMGRYCLFGDTVNTSSRMCTTSTGSHFQVSEETATILRENDEFKVSKRGEVDVKK